MAPISVTRTFLELAKPEQLRPAPIDPRLRVERADPCPPSFFRYLYAEVGRQYHWRDRSAWTDERIAAHLAAPGVSIWVGWLGGAPAGYFELSADDLGNTEIAYFGLLPHRVGQGWGKQLLTVAVRRAWENGARRVWLHTCTLDHPTALPNYVARGFTPFRQEQYEVDLAD